MLKSPASTLRSASRRRTRTSCIFLIESLRDIVCSSTGESANSTRQLPLHCHQPQVSPTLWLTSASAARGGLVAAQLLAVKFGHIPTQPATGWGERIVTIVRKQSAKGCRESSISREPAPESSHSI